MKLRMIACGLLLWSLFGSQSRVHGYGRGKKTKCFSVPTFPTKVENVIKSCQDEVKSNLIDDLLFAAFNENPFDQSKHQHVLKEFEDHLFPQHDHLVHQPTVHHAAPHHIHHSEHIAPHHDHHVEHDSHFGHHLGHPATHAVHSAHHHNPHFHHDDHSSHYIDPHFFHQSPHLHHSVSHVSHIHADNLHHQVPLDLNHHHPEAHHHHTSPFIGHHHSVLSPHQLNDALFHHPADPHVSPHYIYQPSTEIEQIAPLSSTKHVIPEVQEEATENFSQKPIKVVEAHESLKQILSDNKPAASDKRQQHVTSILGKIRAGTFEADEDTSDLLYHRRISKRSLFDLFQPKKEAKVEDYHPAIISHEDRWMAGCLMQCVFRKNNAVDTNGYPTLDGVTDLYTDGTTEQKLFMHVLRAVDKCLKGAAKKHNIYKGKVPLKGETCDVAFDVFDCVSDSLTEYCS